MRNITITLNLKDEHEERLKRITEEYNRMCGHNKTEEEMFPSQSSRQVRRQSRIFRRRSQG